LVKAEVLGKHLFDFFRAEELAKVLNVEVDDFAIDDGLDSALSHNFERASSSPDSLD
jgi:hypothetical protein